MCARKDKRNDFAGMKMIGYYNFEREEHTSVSFRFKNIRILTNLPKKVIKGSYTEGDDFDKVSSSNSEMSMFK